MAASSERSEALVRRLLDRAGVQIGGARPWDITVHNPSFFGRVLTHGNLGLGESYMDGWWDSPSIDQLVDRVLRAEIDEEVRRDWQSLLLVAAERLCNRQRESKAHEIGERHYDVGNDLFRAMLDARMTYSCAYWDGADSLDEAQENKLDLVCRKLGLEPGMRVLDIGCGWGSFARYAAERYGVSVVGVNNSRKQVELATTLCKGLPVEIRYQDYRDVDDGFDRVVSIGMFEHVGPKNYRRFMRVVKRCLVAEGLWLLHTIGANVRSRRPDTWTERYIFPGGVLPTVSEIGKAFEGLFVMEDWENLSAHYDRTLMAWFHNFDANWSDLQSRYDERFYRMWKYYLLTCAGAFRARRNQVWQVIFSGRGIPGGYSYLRSGRSAERSVPQEGWPVLDREVHV